MSLKSMSRQVKQLQKEAGHLKREHARQEINARPLSDYVRIENAANNGKVCPFCGSGEHEKKTGAFSMYRDATGRYKVKCFSCGVSQDTLGALRLLWNCSETEAIERALNVTVDAAGIPAGYSPTRPPMPPAMPTTAPKEQKAGAEPDTCDYFARCREQLQTSDEAQKYLTRRGISADVIRRFGIGYDADARRVVIPCGTAFYVARAIDDNVKARYLNPKGTASALFNPIALTNSGPVFITEGAFDALSIIQAGGEAVALNSTSNAHKVLDALKGVKPDGLRILLALDNDAAGVTTAENLFESLQDAGYNVQRVDVAKPYKDASEALEKGPDGLKKAVHELQKAETAARPDNVLAYMGGGFFQSDLETFRRSASIPTGFRRLDASMNGGLFPGLYVLGAIPSLGKTTLALQIADNVAKCAYVLFFSLEMSTAELVSKSIARTSAEADGTGGAFTSLELRRGIFPKDGQREKATAAYKAYTEKAGRMSIISWDFGAKLGDIADYLRNYVQHVSERPVVFIDYLQIIRPNDTRQTTKEATDATITGLKRLSRETNTCIFVVSSLNRMNYSQEISFESFKESGGIEYTCDVLMGLQLDTTAPKGEDETARRQRIDEAKRANPRKISLVCLKNRYGQLFRQSFDYFTHCDLFMERGGEDEPIERRWKR